MGWMGGVGCGRPLVHSTHGNAFIINFFYPAFNGRRVTKPSPWQSATLEWTPETIPQPGEKSGIVFLTVNK